MRESFTGMPAVAFEDMAVTASMGAIVDRTREHLVPGDLAVIRARRILLSATEDVRAGREPLGVSLRAPAEIQAGEGMVAPGSDWHSLVPRNRTLTGAEFVPEVTDD